MRSSLAGTVIAVAGTVGAIIFGASLGRLLDNPPRYGVDYDLEVGVVGDEASDEEALVEIRELAERDEVAEVSFVRVVQMNLVGESHDGFGMESISGDIGYGIVDGREPAAVDEVVIGAALLDELDLEVGDDFVLPWHDEDVARRRPGRVPAARRRRLGRERTRLHAGRARRRARRTSDRTARRADSRRRS